MEILWRDLKVFLGFTISILLLSSLVNLAFKACDTPEKKKKRNMHRMYDPVYREERKNNNQENFIGTHS
jgi:hypothetical protein